NTSRNHLQGVVVENLVGEFGSTLADLLLQAFGYPAFLLPIVCAIFGWRWLRSKVIENPGFKAIGLVGLFASGCALCGLLFPNFLDLGWTLKAGGLAGDLFADWLRARFNLAGSLILSLSCFIVSLFVATTFSFARSIVFLQARFGSLESWKRRWQTWRKAREKEKERVALDKKLKNDLAEPRPTTVITQSVADLKEKGAASARRVPKEPSPRDQDFAVAGPRITERRIQVEKAQVIATGTRDFIFPAVSMLRPSGSQEAVDEKEL